ncbi:MAG: FRG domain-containing protein [Acholeplasmatales bacterium]|nr:FRG domain-containing protein [Acholeplasmatales bacterium]
MAKILRYIKNILESVKTLKKRFGEDCLIAYRGEPKDFGDGKRLIPSLFRGDYTLAIQKEKEYGNLLKDYRLIEDNSNKLHTSIESQHYIAQSRLLDVSFNFLNSLFFLTSEDNKMNEDGVIYVFGFPSYFSPNDDDIKQLFLNSISKSKFVIDKNFKVLTNCWINDRVKSQQGGFILFLGDTPYDIPDIYYEKITIKKKDYEGLRKELFELYGLNKFSLFPEIESFKEIIKSKKIERNYSIDIFGQVNEFLDRLDLELSVERKKGKEMNYILRRIYNEKKYLNKIIDRYLEENSDDLKIKNKLKDLKENIERYLQYEINRYGGEQFNEK